MSRAAAALALLLVGPVTACSGAEADETTLTVFAASSLTATFEQLEERFEAEHPAVDVRISFGGSSDLAAQIREGAPADVFASADTTNMEALGELVTDPRPFATNTLTIAVPPGNPAGVGSFADLGRPGLRLVVCAPAVPCGAAARRAADVLGVPLRPVSEEQSVTDVVGKVASGEADAGLVYVTDVRAAGDTVEGVQVPEAAGVVNTYPIAPVTGSGHEELAGDFVDLVLGEEGRSVLRAAGFGAP